MFKSEEQANTRLNSDRNLANRFSKVPDPVSDIIPRQPEQTEVVTPKPENVTVTELKQPGNREGKKKLAFHQRNEIAIRSRLGESQVALAKEFGVSQNTVSAIERGKTKVDERAINERLDDVQDVAMSKLLTSLGYITTDKMEKLDAVKLSVVASNMSRVIGSIRRNEDDGPKVVVQIYAPELKAKSSFKSIDV